MAVAVVFIMNLIPTILAVLSLVNSGKMIQMTKKYTQSPANTPFDILQKLHTRVIVFMIINIVIGFNFSMPLAFATSDEFLNGVDYRVAAFAGMLEFVLMGVYISAFVVAVVALAKYGSANKLRNQIVYQNNLRNNQGAANQYHHTPYSQPVDIAFNPNTKSPQQDLNGFQVVGQRSNDVPEGYEAPPVINNGYGTPSYGQPQRTFYPQNNTVQTTNNAAQKEVLNKTVAQKEYTAPQPAVTQTAKPVDIPPVIPVSSGFDSMASAPVNSNPFENRAEKRCSSCGVVNPATSKFCTFCGKEL